MTGAASKKKLENKVALLQDHFKGKGKEESLDTGEWSPENIKQRRREILRRETPWVLEGMTASEWYDLRIKPLQEKQVA